ncbi:MAG: hypothetical protein CMF70_11450 [Magnetovibrio sp.]|nr:hypothetical protein [Magnetovibrio sp.]|tara:strand:+ start:316 stop:600 length:285 start_codon:yes stop_codon:yes gene_type:complete
MKIVEKNILVLARNDNGEAARVAAGLTISGHRVRLVFMGKSLSQESLDSKKIELLELTEILPETTDPELKNLFSFIDEGKLAETIFMSDVVINL